MVDGYVVGEGVFDFVDGGVFDQIVGIGQYFVCFGD